MDKLVLSDDKGEFGWLEGPPTFRRITESARPVTSGTPPLASSVGVHVLGKDSRRRNDKKNKWRARSLLTSSSLPYLARPICSRAFPCPPNTTVIAVASWDSTWLGIYAIRLDENLRSAVAL